MQNYNPFFNNPNYLAPQMNRLNYLENQYPQYANNNYMNNSMPNIPNTQNVVLQGKAVDSIDVVKAMDVPLDGSITYFPKTDGTAIYTKQLQNNGTSKINVYELNVGDIPTNNITNLKNNVSKEDIDKIYKNISDVKQSLEKNMNDLLKRFDELKTEINVHPKEEVPTKHQTKGGK